VEERDNLAEQSLDGRIIFRWTLQKQEEYVGFIYFAQDNTIMNIRIMI
jgi:hypothetical protein